MRRTETDIRQHDVDIAAASLVNITPALSPDEWHDCADQNHGRTRVIYRRCAEIALARLELAGL